MPDVEILMGTHNGAAHLGPQLASFTKQTVQDWALTVSDDRSRDKTRAMLYCFAATCPQGALRLSTGPGQGAAANYLTLLAHSDPSARFIALADQDDIWFPDRLERGRAALVKTGPGPAVYAAATRLVDADGAPVTGPIKNRVAPSFANALVQNVMAGNTIMMNQAAAALLRRHQPSVCPPFHDWWIYAVLAGAGAQVILDPTPVLDYRQHAGAVLGAHHGALARLRRVGMVFDGTWRRWLQAHHRALHSVSDALTPDARGQLEAIISASARDRPRAMRQAGAHRQDALETAAFTLATALGFA